jgi:iron complex outermembrane receptor protein
VAISAPRNDGYFHNVANGQSVGATDLWYGEAQIEWDILDNLQLWAVWRSSEWDDTALYGGYGLGTYVTNRQYGVGALGPSPTFGYSQTGLTQVGTVTQNPQLTDHRAVNEDTIPHRTLDDTNIYGLHLDWDLGDVAVRYIYGGQEYVYHQTTDFDGTPVTSYLNAFGPYGGVETRATIFPSYVLEYEEDKSWYSHELTIASQGDGPVQWIAGLYQFHDEYDQPVSVDMPNQPQVGAPTYNYFCSGALGSVSVGPIPGPVDDFVCLGGGGPYFFPWGGTAAGGGPIPLAPANPQRSVFFATHAANNYSYAVFGQVDWDVSDQWQLTLGLRYTEDEKRIREQTRLVCFGNLDFGCTPANSVGYAGYVSQANDVTTRFNSGFQPGGVLAPGVVTAPFTDLVTGRRVRDLAGKWSATTGTTGVQFRPNDDQLLYLRYSRGYKAGSFNAGNVIPDPTADPEFIDAYELGWKGGIGSRFTIESSAFFYNWHDMQVPLTVVQAGASREDLINLAEVEIYGAEFESHWEPVDNLYMLLSYAYLHTEIKEGCCFTSPVDPAAVLPGASRVAFDAVSGSWSQDLAGNPLPQSPEHRVTFNASYMWNFDAGTLIPSLTYIWRDEAYNGIFETPQTVAPAWDQVDLRLTYRTSDDRATIIGFVRNALDEEQYTAAGVNRVITGPGGALPFFVTAPSRLDRTYGIAPPRTYGVEVHFRFN